MLPSTSASTSEFRGSYTPPTSSQEGKGEEREKKFLLLHSLDKILEVINVILFIAFAH
jgi:hypothetical protein